MGNTIDSFYKNIFFKVSECHLTYQWADANQQGEYQLIPKYGQEIGESLVSNIRNVILNGY